MESKNSVNKREDSCSYGLSLTGELQQGKEFARQLQMLLHNDAGAQPHQVREYLVQQIIASFDRAVSIAHQTEPLAPSPPPPPLLTAKSDSPSSGGATSPHSEDSDPVGDLQEYSRIRKKAGQPQWQTKVQVSPETGFEGPPPDGYNWRKYGQKEILRADYPRAYYRCALKNQTRCPATKHVQRCDEDPSTFEVTYKGYHTCNHPTTPSSSHPNPNPRSGSGKETLISFNPSNNPPCFTLHSQQQFPPHNPNQANPNHGFQFHATSSGPTAATSAAVPAAVGATSSASATSSPVDIGGDFPFDQLDFDALEFFH